MEDEGFSLSQETKRSIAAVVSFVSAALFVLGFLGIAGIAGKYLDMFSASIFGWGKWLFPIVLALSGLVLLRRKTKLYGVATVGLAVAFFAILGVCHVFFSPEEFLSVAQEGRGGGYIGYGLSAGLTYLVGRIGAIILMVAFMLIGILVAFSFSLLPVGDMFAALVRKMRGNVSEQETTNTEPRKDEDVHMARQEEVDIQKEEGEIQDNIAEDNDEEKSVNEEAKKQEESNGNIANVRFESGEDAQEETTHDEADEGDAEIFSKATAQFSSDERENQEQCNEDDDEHETRYDDWEFPPMEFLAQSYEKAKSGDIEHNLEIIEETLRQFGIEVEPGEVKVGPTVTQYSFRPAAGVKLEKIIGLGNNLAMALAAHPIRIEAPIPGKALVGIEVPNRKRAKVVLRELLENKKFRTSGSSLTVALGKNVSGDTVFADLEKMPHLLIAGTTGSGKSVCINTILLSLLYQNTPEQLELILVDPKRVELSLYDGIPHLKTPVIVENKKVLSALKWAVGEMERRYEMLQESETRDINSYNKKVLNARQRASREIPPYMSYIVIVIDELADLMASHGKEVEGAIVRLAQMARAVGIHLVIAMQRPSVQVLTGLIKSNITTRISFKVPTQVDSRTILDKGGAEKLLGNGDMLYITSTEPAPKRLQGVLSVEKEVKRVSEFLRQQGRDFYPDEEGNDEMSDTEAPSSNKLDLDAFQENEDKDELFDEAKSIVERAQKASTSLIQRHLRIGYNRAARIMDELEAAGVVGAQDGSKPREVLTAPLDEKTDAMYEDSIEDDVKREKWENS